MGCILMASVSENNSAVERKIQDPKMTTRDNPLLTDEDTRTSAAQREISCRNWRRLMDDAHARTGVHGNVYAGIMGMRY